MRKLVLTLACMLGAANASGETVRIFAAASLTDVLAAALVGFEGAHPGVRVVSQFGSSSDLARQIGAGAPAHLFVSADTRQMDRLVAKGLVEPTACRALFENQLVIVQHRSRETIMTGPEALLDVERFALADPTAVPAGVYARMYLESVGLWERLRTKAIPTLDVRGALAAVASGNAEAGIVYRTDSMIEQRTRVAYEVPREAGPRILYVLGQISGAEGPGVRALFDFLLSTAAGTVFEEFGFFPITSGPCR